MNETKVKRGDGPISPREQRRRNQLDLGRNQLLDAAEEVFGRLGFHDASIKEIAEAAEFSVGSVYTFFENKEDLFQQLFARRGEEYMPMMRAVLGSGDAPRALLRRLVEFQIDYFRTNRMFGRLYLRMSNPALQLGDPVTDELMRGNFVEALELQTELFRSGQRAGEFHEGEPRVLSRLLSGLVAAFQVVDHAVMSDEPSTIAAMTVAEFHDLVERTFCRPVGDAR